MKEYDNNLNEQTIDHIVATLSVPYKDTSVLTTSSRERDLVDYYFKSITCNDEGIENLLYEIIGNCVTTHSGFCRGFIFKGDGRNGKSKIFRILEALLGDNQCSHEHLEDLSGNKLGSKSTVKKLEGCTVNIAEDQKQAKFINTSIITRIISGEPIAIEQKGRESYNLIPYATMLFSVNEVIDFKETGLYITDRLIVIPFNATFTDKNNNRNINIGEELCKPLALQIIATRAIQAFKKVLENGKFTIPPSVEEETKKYFMDCNNVAEFCELFPIKDIMIKSKYYDEYRKWCNRNNKEAVSNAIFGKRVLALGYRAERYSFGNNRHTYYASPNFNNCDSKDVYNRYLINCGLSENLDKTTTEEVLAKYDITSFSEYLWGKSLE